MTKGHEAQARTNPVFNDRRLKLGTFGTNLDRGCAISTIDGVLRIDWPNTLALAKISEEMEFEALVPIGRWHGFGGKTNFNGPASNALPGGSSSGRTRRKCSASSPWRPKKRPGGQDGRHDLALQHHAVDPDALLHGRAAERRPVAAASASGKIGPARPRFVFAT